jgi:gliding motility-associated-like protein
LEHSVFLYNGKPSPVPVYLKKTMRKLLTIFYSLSILGLAAQSTPQQQLSLLYEKLIFEMKDAHQVHGKPFDKGVAARVLEKKNVDKAHWSYIIQQAAAFHEQDNVSALQSQATGNSATNRIPENPTPNSGACPNAGFENGNFSGWSGDTWTLTGTDWTVAPSWTSGVVSNGFNTFLSDPNGRHTIMTSAPGNNDPTVGPILGFDSLSINPTTGKAEIPFVSPTGSGISVRLGNAQRGAQTERLVYPMAVTAANALFTLQYAVVLEGIPGGPTSQHQPDEQPFFNITVLDQSGNPISGCASYAVNVTQAWSDPTFIQNTNVPITIGGWASTVTVFYKNWTLIGIDLTPYIGQNIQMEFRSADCSQSGHFGYAYLDLMCSTPQITVNFCGNNQAVFVGPSGFTGYQWYGPNGMTMIAGATNDTLTVTNPVIGDVYSLVCIAQNGCNVTMTGVVQPTVLSVQNVLTTPSCLTGNSGTATVFPAGSSLGNYTYVWQTSPGGVTVSTSQTATGLSPGQYSVTVSAAGCGNADTIVTVPVSPPVYYVQTQNFCGTSVSVAAPTGSNYLWYDQSGSQITGATSANLNVANPTNNSFYFVVFNTATGCRDSVKIVLTQTIVQSTLNLNFCGTVANLCAPTGATSVNWYDANWPYSNIGSTTCVAITNPTVSTWSPYYLSYTDPGTGCLDSVQVYLTNTPLSVYPTSIVSTCVGLSSGSVTLNTNSSSAATFTLSVTGPQNFTNNSAGTVQSIPNLPAGTYNVSVNDGVCSATSTFKIDTISVQVYTSVTPDTICAGQSAVVTFTYTGSNAPVCGAGTSGCGATSTQTIGTNSSQNTSTDYPCVYGNWYSNEKYQLLYSAADLLAAGVTPGKISSIAFDVVSIPTGMNTTFKNYKIKMGCTSASDLNPTGAFGSIPWQPVNQVVWGPQDYVVTAGWNTHTLTTTWQWDGTSNLVIEICYDWVASSTYTDNAIMNNTTTSYNSYLLLNDDFNVACPSVNGESSYMSRPVTRFTTCQTAASPSDYTYSWSPSTGVSGTPPTVNLAPSVTTTYTVAITSNYGNCVKQDTIPLTVINPFSINMPVPASYCLFEPRDTLSATTTPSVNSGVWSGPGMADAGNALNGYFTPGTAGLGNWYAYFTAGSGGCILTDSVLLSVTTGVNPAVSAAGPFCVNANAINLNPVTPGGVFSGNGIVDATAGTFNPAVAGVGTSAIKYVFNGACADSSTINILVNAQPVISISADTTEGCMPTNIAFTSTVSPANGNVQWTFSDGFTGNTLNIVHTFADTGSFDVEFIYTDANTCSDTIINVGMITVHPAVTAAFVASPVETTIIDPIVYFTSQSQNATLFNYQFTADTSSTLENPSYMFTDVGSFDVMLVAANQYGCTDTAFNTIVVQSDIAVYIPNAFTPGDENHLNDTFVPMISGIDEKTFKFEVYDRWGGKIFQTDELGKGWTGRDNNDGALLPTGIYVWKIYYRDNKKKKITKVGHIQLIK